MAILDSQNNYLLLVNIQNKECPIIEKMSESIICNSRWAYRKNNKYFISDFWQHNLMEVSL